MERKNLAYKIALEHIEAAQVTPEQEATFMKVLDKVNKKQISTADEFYNQLTDIGLDKLMLKDIVTKIISSGKSEDVVKMVFLLGEGKPIGDSSPSKGLRILTESWIQRQLDDRELTRRIKSKYWPLFRNKAWLEKEQKEMGKEKSI